MEVQRCEAPTTERIMKFTVLQNKSHSDLYFHGQEYDKKFVVTKFSMANISY
jgi:hypothetical protein